MNFNLYIYGTPEGRYNQYPNDYTASLLEEWQKGAKGARLVIYRKMNLVYYGYTERLNNEGNYIGFCVVFNNARVLKPKLLIQYFKTVVEDYLVKSGDIIKYSEDGKIHYNLRAFNEGNRAFDKLKELISSEFDSNESKYGIVPLDSIYNGINSFETIDSSASDSQILALTNKYNKVIINDANGAEASYLNKLIANMKAENVSAKEKIKSLESEVEKVNRQKKQYRMVVFLVLAVAGCLVALYIFNNNIQSLTGDLSQKKEEIKALNSDLTIANAKIDTISLELSDKNQRIVVLQKESVKNRNSIDSLNSLTQTQETVISDLRSDLSSANSSLSSTKSELSQTQRRLSNYQNKVGKHLPLIVTDIEIANHYKDSKEETGYGGTIYSKNSMYLAPRISYIGLVEGTRKFLIKLYRPDGTLSTGSPSSETPKGYSYSASGYIYEGENKRELSGCGNEKKGNWPKGTYKIEVWYNDMCLKAKSFTIY